MASRLTPEHRLHEARFRALAPMSKLCWHTLSGVLGASGIAVCYAETVVGLTGCGAADVAAALEELEAGGWLRRDGAVVWMIEGLEEQGLNGRNPNHRSSVLTHLATLEPIAPAIVAEYRAHYTEWLQPHDGEGSGEAAPPKLGRAAVLAGSQAESIGDGIRDGIEIAAGSRRKEEGGGEDGGEGPTATAATQARTELVELLPEAYEPDLDGLLARVPAQSHHSWLRSLLALASGLHPPGAGLPNAVPAASLGEAIRQFNTNGETNWKRFTGYVRDVLTPRAAPAADGGGGRGAGSRTEQAAAAGRQTYETVLRVAGAMRDQAGTPEAAIAGTAVTPLARRVAP